MDYRIEAKIPSGKNKAGVTSPAGLGNCFSVRWLFLWVWLLVPWVDQCLVAATPPWDSPAFTADAVALYEAAAAETAPAGSHVLILLDERRYVYDVEGRKAFTVRSVYRILDESAIDDWSMIDAIWEPWHQERPSLRARVITKGGTAYTLDPKTVAESGIETNQPGVFTDRKILRAPLPAVGAGAVVEEEITISENAPLFDRGTVNRVYFGGGFPVRQSRLILDAPMGLPLHYMVQLMPNLELHKEETGGRVRWTFEQGPLEAITDVESFLPSDVPQWPNIGFATGTSWNQVASRYSEVINDQLRGSDVKDLVQPGSLAGKGMRETAATLVARLHKEIRYTGVEYGEASLVPRSPAETLQRKYGDCKDKALLLTAMLRQAGFSASLALLNTYGYHDADPDLPGLGSFNHAIVYVKDTKSGTDLWIDATDQYARIGSLPLGDQGRMALIVSPDTTSLVRTPQSTSADNRTVETREFHLSEYGPADVIEESEAWGSIEESYREHYAGLDRETLRKEFEAYAKAAYASEELGGEDVPQTTDFSEPYRIRLEMSKAHRGQTDQNEAAVAIIPNDLLSRLPSVLSAGIDNLREQGSGVQKDAPAVTRKNDLVLLEPYSVEWRYRIVPPPGFTPRPLPESRVQQLGPAVFSKQFKLAENGVVLATLRFDTVKNRYSPEEVDALLKGGRDLLDEGATLITFEQTGESYLAAGKVKEALDEFRGLIAMYPNEGLHHSRLAQALLAAGAGEAARKEAQRAADMEPTSPLIYEILGMVLRHDQVGRPSKEAFDLALAESAYRKAIELDPDNPVAQGDLAILLEHNSRGVRYGKGARLDKAIEQYQALQDRIGENGLSDNMLIAMLWAGQYKEMREAAQQLTQDTRRRALALIATAALEGADAAIQEASRSGLAVETRRDILQQAGETLMQLRMYPEAVALLSASVQGNPNSAAILARVGAIRNARRHEDLSYPETDPRTVVKQFFVTLLSTDALSIEDLYPLMSKLARKDAEEERDENSQNVLRAMRNDLARLGVSPEVLLDIMLGVLELRVDGNDSMGYRITTQSPGTSGGPLNMTFYVVKENGQYKILDAGQSANTLGEEVLGRFERGEPDGARRLLDWVREDQPLPGGDDPLAGTPFPRLWMKGATNDPETIRYAAASLMVSGEHFSEQAADILREASANTSSTEIRQYLDLALASAQLRKKRFAEALLPVQRLIASFPESKTAFLMWTRVLSGLERWDECEKAIEDRLKKFPDDTDALGARMHMLERQGKVAEAVAIGRTLIQAGKAGPDIYNEIAWAALVRGNLTAEDIQAAQRASLLTQNSEPNILHTLAAVYAEVGQTSEARETLLRMMDLSGLDEPNGPAWFVFGRIAEQFGILDVAAADYRKVDDADPSPVSTYGLAHRRLEAIEQQQRDRGNPNSPTR